MDLWIRSQDKTKLVKVDNIVYMDSSEDYEKEVHSLWNDCKGILGTYKTKEKALEVLDEIQTILRGKYATSFDYKTSLKGFKPEEIEHMLELMAVYEMPVE